MNEHRIEFDDSFAAALAELDQKDPEARDEWGGIVAELQNDPFYKPASPPHIVQQGLGEGICSCQHESGWCGWALFWEYETHLSLVHPITLLRIFAERAPQIRLTPQT